jgi:hypothetical protein
LLIGTPSVLLPDPGACSGSCHPGDGVLTGGFDVLPSFPAHPGLTLVTVFASGAGTSYGKRMTVLILALGVVSIPVPGE